jgi:hypothetical protein
MSAHIVKRADHAILAACGNDRITGEGGGYIVAGALKLVLMRKKLPAASKDIPPLGFVNGGVAIELRGQGLGG